LVADDPARPSDDEDRREAEHEALEVEPLKVRADRQEAGERDVRDEPCGERMPRRIAPARRAEQLAPLELADDVRPLPGARTRHPTQGIEAGERQEAQGVDREPYPDRPPVLGRQHAAGPTPVRHAAPPLERYSSIRDK